MSVEMRLLATMSIPLDWEQRIEIPMELPPTANPGRYGLSHRMALARLRKKQRDTTIRDCSFLLKRVRLPVEVTLVRVSKCPLDDDGNVHCLKGVRDGVADWLGINDRDRMVRWVYDQRTGKERYGQQKLPGYQAVIINVRSRRPGSEGAAG